MDCYDGGVPQVERSMDCYDGRVYHRWNVLWTVMTGVCTTGGTFYGLL